VLFFAGQLQGLGIAWDYFLAGKVNFHSDIRRDNYRFSVNIQSLDHQKMHHLLPLSMLVTTKC
jgi:hypothetical protein